MSGHFLVPSRHRLRLSSIGSSVVTGMIAWFGILFGVAFLVRLALEILIAAYLT
jgi:hypothetical protein